MRNSTEDSRPSLREAHKQLTLQKLLDAARKVFHRKGYAKATVDDIVDEAKVSRGTFYVYFRSKSEILSDLFATEHIQEVIKLVDDLPTEVTVARLRSWIAEYFKLYSDHRLTIRAWIQAGSREAVLRTSSLALMDQVLDGLSDKVREIRRLHHLPASSEERAFRALLMLIQMQEFAYYPYIRGYPVNESLGLDILAEQWYAALLGPDARA